MGSSSWLTAVKRAFRSPTKDTKSTRRKVDHPQEFDDEKKTERRRWLFKKQSPAPDCAPKTPDQQRYAIAVAAATAAAAEAAVATAKAAVEIIRLTQPGNAAPATSSSYKQQSAAKVIQTAFRGYLARKALIALKGIVKLQALIRGQNVRKQANMTLKCMQALLRVQARVRDQRARLSHDGGRRSMFAETSNLWESRYLKDVRDRRSRSRDGSSVTDDWRECPLALEELEALVKVRNDHQRSLAVAFSQQNKIMESDGEENEVDKWISTKPNHFYHRRDSIKTVDLDSLKTPSYSRPRPRCQSPVNRHRPKSPHLRPPSPRSDDKSYSYSTANTPSLRSTPRPRYSTSGAAAVPNYMVATESAKARIRSQSAPRQRPSTPEREREKPDRVGSAKKRLSYPIPDPYCVNFGFGCGNNLGRLRSPSFKSVQAGYVGMEAAEQYSNYTESVTGGEISPCSTTDLRRWLR